jgi:hypothetical protein
MSKVRARQVPPLAAMAVCVLLAAGCSKQTPTPKTTTTTRIATATVPTVTPTVAPKPVDGLETAMATGPGIVGDTSQTAALSAPANTNGTTPSRGVAPPPSR